MDETDAKFLFSSKNQVPRRSSASVPQVDLDADDEYYKMDHPHRGMAIIFNHFQFSSNSLTDRSGTQADCEKLKNTLTRLKFYVQVLLDYSTSEIENYLSIVSDIDHSQSDCLVVAVLTHGDKDELHSRNGHYQPSKLWRPFVGNACPSLAGKPKLFFIQACRGEGVEDAVPISTRKSRVETDSSFVAEESRHVITIPNKADLLIMNSTFEDNVSFRNPESGSWFINSLCNELNARALRHDLFAILTAVNRRLGVSYESNVPSNAQLHQKKQIAVVQSTLTRLVQFR